MRRRLILSSLLVALVAVAILGLPLAWAGDRLIGDEAQRSTSELAARIARYADSQLGVGEPLSQQWLDQQTGTSRRVRVLLPDGSVVVAGEPGAQAARATQGTAEGATVVVTESDRTLQERRRNLLVLLAVAASTAFAAAAGVGIVVARRLGAPLVDLARAAERFGEGQSNVPPVRSGVPEVDTVGRVLQASGQRVAATLAAESQFATDVSHQLRTPLTAMSLRLEEIAATDDIDVVRAEAQSALDQVQRLTEVVQSLRRRSRTAHTGLRTVVDVDALLEQQLREWRPAFVAVRRALLFDSAAPLRVLASPGGVTQVLATLVENSLVHGAGTTTMRTRSPGHSVVIEVTDEGLGVPPDLGDRVFQRTVSGGSGTGLGLALARDLAEADGGRLALLAHRPPVFALFLPSAPEAASSVSSSGQEATESEVASCSVDSTISRKTNLR